MESFLLTSSSIHIEEKNTLLHRLCCSKNKFFSILAGKEGMLSKYIVLEVVKFATGYEQKRRIYSAVSAFTEGN